MRLRLLLYLVLLVEGYSVLAIELLGIRLLVPFVGNSVETVSILVAAVLMPLAVGYYAGGNYRARARCMGKIPSIRKKLISNLVTAILILSFGLSYQFLVFFFFILKHLGIHQVMLQVSSYAVCFILYPIFLLGQTIPLLSHYFSEKKLSDVTGKMLFFSTLGSFLGSIISTLVFMAVFGVHNTVILTILLLGITVLMIGRKRFYIQYGWAVIALSITILWNNSYSMKKAGVIGNNNYSTIQIIDHPEDGSRILSINHSYSSKYAPRFEDRFSYIQYVENTLLKPYERPDGKKRSILVIGAGGCILGLDDHKNTYTFVDIDGSLKRVTEQAFLKQPLGENKTFITASARLFFKEHPETYDLIFIDTYSNALSIPPELVTQEFFTQVKAALAPDGVMAANIIASPNFHDRYSMRVDNTIRSVFPHINRQIIDQSERSLIGQAYYTNIIYSYFNNVQTGGVYTDDKNTYFLDKEGKF